MSKYKGPVVDVSGERKFFIGIGLATLLILVGGVWLVSVRGEKQQKKLTKPLVGEEIPIQNTAHIKPGEAHDAYNSNPPTSGWMYDDVAGAGIHDSEAPDEKLIHSMEHGAAVVWYKSDLSKEDVEKIAKAFSDVSGKKIMVPRQNLDTPVALTSWGRLLKLQTIEEEKIREFITTNEDRAPEKAAI